MPFASIIDDPTPQSPLRAAITAACRTPEPACVAPLIEEARLAPEVAAKARALAQRLVLALRAKRSGGGIDALIHEFSLSSQEGVALMCVAEALLRIPDAATRDALIRDKIGGGDWAAHGGAGASLFVNAATWGLMITGKLVATSSEQTLGAAVTRLVAKGGEPLIRKAVDLGMRLLGEQFVSGETIEGALATGRRQEARGFTHSYDMLGEAATTAEDAERYRADYERAIHAIGAEAAGRGVYAGPGISLKLSALHPRFVRAQRPRVQAELLPRLRALALLARRYDIGFNIDAEEASRLDLCLDLLEALSLDGELAGWNGLGFVVQAYQRRAPQLVDWMIDLARRSRRRLMLRLVKGAYWDAEIKRAQLDGLADYPVFTRKTHSDVCYLACARRALAAPEAIYPQFATHNALTLASVYHLADGGFHAGRYEFQCLHGMGEPLYEHVVAPVAAGGLERPCRIYAPVGTHETLLAYLVRRLLENGSNSSFVNRIADPAVAVDELVADPVALAEQVVPVGAPHPAIPLPCDLFGAARRNSAGVDLADEQVLRSLAQHLRESAAHDWRARPMLAEEAIETRAWQDIRNPADRADRVGGVIEASAGEATAALRHAAAAAPAWASTPVPERAACLERAASALETGMPMLLGLLVREAGKSCPDAVAEVREAVDFLRYYAAEARRDFGNDTHLPLGPVVCISPWNFPLAIFLGQVSAALAAGNPVVAKPAEQTPLVAAEAIRILRAAGVPAGAVQLLPGPGETIGAALVADALTQGVLFTGSTVVAQSISRTLAQRLGADGHPVTLIAETGGQNAMIVDSSALPEQVVQDVLQSAFGSAGQRCSALRVLCVQEEIADTVVLLVKGAMRELALGNPDRLDTDVGPVIDDAARRSVERHIAQMAARGHRVHRESLPAACAAGTFVPPTLIELDRIGELDREVFGPVLHVVRFPRSGLDALLADIRATGYGLTFGVHSRIDETIRRALDGVRAGNLYVNRNMVGAVVGVQPFGGEGLSGTGPKAGGPLYLRRLLAACTAPPAWLCHRDPRAGDELRRLRDWLVARGDDHAARIATRHMESSPAGLEIALAGPTGEQNTYELHPRGTVLCRAQSRLGALAQLAALLATGNAGAFVENEVTLAVRAGLPRELRPCLRLVPDTAEAMLGGFAGALFEGERKTTLRWHRQLAAGDGAIVTPQCRTRRELAADDTGYSLERLLTERSISVNTAAAGGNASLMTLE